MRSVCAADECEGLGPSQRTQERLYTSLLCHLSKARRYFLETIYSHLTDARTDDIPGVSAVLL